jgi:catalase
VPGIGPSPDKMLQSRLFNYADAQRYRLGVNYHQIPVNAARCPVHSNHRDGQGRADGNYGGLPHYEPNSFHQWQEQPQYREPPLKISGDADWWNFRDNDANYYKQPGDLFRLMTPTQQQALFDNTARAMGDAPDFIKQRHVDNCTKADPAYGAGVEAALRKLGAFAGTTSPNSLGEEAQPASV